MSQTQFVLGVPPPSWNDDEQFRIHCGISGIKYRFYSFFFFIVMQISIVIFHSLLFLAGLSHKIEPIGSQFLAHARRKLNNHSFSEDDRIQAEAATEQAEEVISEDEEEETPELLNRDPKDWKVIIVLKWIDLSFKFNKQFYYSLSGTRSLCNIRSL